MEGREALPRPLQSDLLQQSAVRSLIAPRLSPLHPPSSHPQLKEIANIKLPDLNANSVEAAMKTVGGTARNMGIVIKDK